MDVIKTYLYLGTWLFDGVAERSDWHTWLARGVVGCVPCVACDSKEDQSRGSVSESERSGAGHE
jgi:hypothetical protein